MKYYVAKNGASIGPFSVEEIHVKLTTGELHTSDQCVADDGSSAWQPIARRLANELPQLAAAPQQQPQQQQQQAGGTMLSPGFHPKQGGGGFAEFVLLRKMLTPTFIQIIYIIGVGVIFLGWLVSTCVSLFSGHSRYYSPYGYGYGGPPTFVVVLGLFVGLFVSLILWRVYCELLIVIFRIHDFLRDIRDAQTARAPGGA